MLNDYIANRQTEDEYLSHFRIGGHTFFSFGYYGRTKKLAAALSFKMALECGEIDFHHLKDVSQGALSQGRLGQITKLSHIIQLIEQSLSTPSLAEQRL